MKKVLMVMGFALCASIAFAQTARIVDKNDAKKYETVSTSAVKAPVDYKATIFSKANGHDTIQVFTFGTSTTSTIGVIAASDIIDDTAAGSSANNISIDAAKWKRYTSLNNFRSNVATQQPQLAAMWSGSAVDDICDRMDPSLSPREGDDDGFMLLSYRESSAPSGRINTYFTLPDVQRPADAVMIEVSLTQAYAKYYDRCYIDYYAGGQWWAREVNVTGIDADVNYWSAVKVRYVMPYRLNTESTIKLRVRGYSYHRGNTWGYFWAVDNVAVMKLTQTQFWALNGAQNIDGFYGMIPEGMTIPATWGVNAQNLSVDPINNAKATLYAGTNRNTLTEAFYGPSVNVTSGNFDTVFPIVIDERGFYDAEDGEVSMYQGWFYRADNYANTGALTGGFQGRGLPTATSGKNFYNITVAGGDRSNPYDTILYWVSPMQEYASTAARESGYRWSHDNGIIPTGASFQTAFTDDGYVTGDGSDLANGGHVGMAGYAVHTRFVTPSVIPTDDNGEPWVFRGLELITATDRDYTEYVGAAIAPIAYVDVPNEDASSINFSSLPCGIDGMSFEVQEDEINRNLVENNLGYLTPDQPYKSINIKFVEQPELEPNTSYRFGYRLLDDANFALAGTRRSFEWTASDDTTYTIGFSYGTGANDTVAEFANKAANANDYRYIGGPTTYLEVIVYDPIEESNLGFAQNIDNYPMIRPIVGPRRAVEYATVGAICDDNTHGVMVTRGDDELCGQQIQVVAGSQQRIDFDPIGDHSVIDSVLLNGVALAPYDEEDNPNGYYTGDATVYENPDNPRPDQILLERNFWVVYLSGIQANQTYDFTVYSHYEEWNYDPTNGIDPVAPEVKLAIAPNPASSSVKLNIEGVEGKVNCSILDMSGRVIYNANINAESEHMINVSNLPSGAYFVRVTNDTFSKIEKLIIK